MLVMWARNKGILAETSLCHILVTVWTWINLDAGKSAWFWGGQHPGKIGHWVSFP